ncbi:MAG: histidine kinase N-terminal 7TM domain-containing protein [Candidatus Saccharibacteria bacterium]|nr:histidine kinase N-terminal 7TM domain-containing protein [Candidatus Saccharibacteria bacterium]
MELIRALLIAAIIIVILSGISVFLGSRGQEKKPARYFLIATLGAALWTLAIYFALNVTEASSNLVHFIITCIISGVILMDVGLLAFLGYGYKGGRLLTLLFTVGGTVLIALLAYDSSLFYSSYDLSQGYIRVIVDHNWHFFALISYFILISITHSSYLLRRIEETKNPGFKTGLKIFSIGLSIGGILALLFDLILLTSLPSLIWIGPLATIISIMAFYYSVVKYRVLDVSSKWVKVMSSVILVGVAVIIYLLAFYVISKVA